MQARAEIRGPVAAALGMLLGLALLAAPPRAEAGTARGPSLPPLRAGPPREIEPAKGAFLVASRQITDPHFAGTVVLLLRHDDESGAMGLVINRPTQVDASALLPEVEGIEEQRLPVYFGGPLEAGRILLLLRSRTAPEGSRRIFEEVHLSSSRLTLRNALEHPGAADRLRIYAGYAGWAAGQLEAEIGRGDWHVVPAKAEAVFSDAPDRVWKNLIEQLSGRWARWSAPTPRALAAAQPSPREAGEVYSSGSEMALDFETLVNGPFQENCFLVWDDETRRGILVDPGDEAERLVRAATFKSVQIEGIYNTHAHLDHAGAAAEIQKRLEVPFALHPGDRSLLEALPQQARAFGLPSVEAPTVDRELEDGETLEVAGHSFTVAHTPGHTPGGVCFLFDGTVLAGDTLFCGSIGRTDLPGGSLEQLLESIEARLLPLEDDTRVLCGHGPATTIGAERQYNPFLHGLG